MSKTGEQGNKCNFREQGKSGFVFGEQVNEAIYFVLSFSR